MVGQVEEALGFTTRYRVWNIQKAPQHAATKNSTGASGKAQACLEPLLYPQNPEAQLLREQRVSEQKNGGVGGRGSACLNLKLELLFSERTQRFLQIVFEQLCLPEAPSLGFGGLVLRLLHRLDQDIPGLENSL